MIKPYLLIMLKIIIQIQIFSKYIKEKEIANK